MYIMCICLFSALSRRVGALQISIIIIIVCAACGLFECCFFFTEVVYLQHRLVATWLLPHTQYPTYVASNKLTLLL